MTTEQKAKAYDEALINGSRLWECGEITKESYEYLFPEIKESEDERIRKEIIEFIKVSKPEWENYRDYSSWIVWLEKQGEQNLIEIHPIFRAGDIIRNKRIYDEVLIEQLDMNNKVYYHKSFDGAATNHSDLPFSQQNEWEIIDQHIDVETQKQWIPVKPVSEEDKLYLMSDEQNPYPKTLDQAIELYYYTYGNGKGGFNNLSFEKFKDIVKTFVEDYGNKHNWSEEDEEMLEDIRFNFIYNKEKMTDAMIAQYNHFFDKIKSLKPQPKQEWSEEDERILKAIIINIKNLQFSEDIRENYYHISNTSKNYYQIMVDFLNSIKDKVQPQPKQEWSKEDEKMYNRIYDLIHNAAFGNCDVDEDGKELGEYAKIINWFKFIKDRVR